MKASTHTARSLGRWIALALSVVAVSVPAAQAASRTAPDGLDRYLANNLGNIQAQAAADAAPDAVDRYLRNNLPLSRLALNDSTHNASYDSLDLVGSQFDTSRFYDSLDLVGSQTQTGRFYDSPELVSSQPKPTPAPIAVGAPGFDWADAGIGAGIAFGAMLLAFAAAFGVRSRGRVAHSQPGLRRPRRGRPAARRAVRIPAGASGRPSTDDQAASE